MTRLLALLALAFGLAACGDLPPPVVSGQPAPPFTAADLAGEPRSFPADFAGRPVVVRFWADWCPYCAPEMRAIETVYREVGDSGLEVLAVNVGQDRDTAADFMEDLGVSYPGLLDPESAVARRYRVVGLPTSFFVDRDGVVQGKILGEADTAAFREMLGRIL
jgi:peroxiredoxin